MKVYGINIIVKKDISEKKCTNCVALEIVKKDKIKRTSNVCDQLELLTKAKTSWRCEYVFIHTFKELEKRRF